MGAHEHLHRAEAASMTLKNQLDILSSYCYFSSMKKLTTLLITTAVLAGCAATPTALIETPDEIIKESSQPLGEESAPEATEEPTIEPKPTVGSEPVDVPIVEGPGPAEKSATRLKNDIVNDVVEEGWTDAPSEMVNVPIVEDGYVLSSEIIDDGICKLRENSSHRAKYPNSLAASFPSLTYEIPHTGKVNVALVFLEWGDLKGTDADYKYWLEQASMFEDFYYMVSEGKLNIEIHQQKQWFEVGPTYVDYKMSQAEDGGNYHSKDIMQKNGDAFIAASDAGTDFSGMDAIIFAIPRAKEVFETGPHAFGHNKQNGIRTNEGTIYDWISAGTWFIEHPTQPSWVFYSHEFGHSLGLIDFRDNSRGDMGEKYLNNPMGGYEIMDNQGGPTRTMTAWVRWLQGWLNDSQVVCIDSKDVTTNYYKINQLNKIGGEVEALVIKTSPTTAVVVESRRWDAKFDVPVVNSKDGIVIYTVDSTKGHSEGPLRLVSPRNIKKYLSEPKTYPDWRTLDAIFYKGDSITVQGVTITVESLSSFGDIVKISK